MTRIEPYSCEKQQLWNDVIERSKFVVFTCKKGYTGYHSNRFDDYSPMFCDGEELNGIFSSSIKDGSVTSHAKMTYGDSPSPPRVKQHTTLEHFDSLLDNDLTVRGNKLIYTNKHEI